MANVELKVAEPCVMELLDSLPVVPCCVCVCAISLSAPQTTAVGNVGTIKMIISVTAADKEIEGNASARSVWSCSKHDASLGLAFIIIADEQINVQRWLSG